MVVEGKNNPLLVMKMRKKECSLAGVPGASNTDEEEGVQLAG